MKERVAPTAESLLASAAGALASLSSYAPADCRALLERLPLPDAAAVLAEAMERKLDAAGLLALADGEHPGQPEHPPLGSYYVLVLRAVSLGDDKLLWMRSFDPEEDDLNGHAWGLGAARRFSAAEIEAFGCRLSDGELRMAVPVGPVERMAVASSDGALWVPNTPRIVAALRRTAWLWPPGRH